MHWPLLTDSPHAQTSPDTAPPFRLAITPYRKRLPLPMTSHYRKRRTFAGQTESPSRKCMGIRERTVLDSAFSCELGVPFGVFSLASHRLPHPSLPALASQRMRLRPNGMAVRGSLVLWLTIVRLFVRVGGNRMCSGRHPTTARMRKRHRVTHLHSFWPPRHTENVCPCR